MSIITDLERQLSEHPDDPRAVIPLRRPQVERIAALLAALADALGDELLRCPTWPQEPPANGNGHAAPLCVSAPLRENDAPPRNANSSTEPARPSSKSRRYNISDADLAARVYAELRRLAAGDTAPAQRVWDAHQLAAAEPLPTASGVCKRLGVSWDALVGRAGLLLSPQARTAARLSYGKAVPKAPLPAPAPTPQPEPEDPGPVRGNIYKMTDAALLAAVIAALQAVAVDGVAPSQKAWDKVQRASSTPLPTKTAVSKRLGLDWAQLVERAGLTLSPAAATRVALARERAAQAPAQPAPGPDDDPPPFTALPRQEAREAAAFAEVVAAARRRPPVTSAHTLDGKLVSERALPDLVLPDGTRVVNRTQQVIAIR